MDTKCDCGFGKLLQVLIEIRASFNVTRTITRNIPNLVTKLLISLVP